MARPYCTRLRLKGCTDTAELEHVSTTCLFSSPAHEVTVPYVESYRKGVIYKQICANESVLAQLLALQTDNPAFLTFADLTQT